MKPFQKGDEYIASSVKYEKSLKLLRELINSTL
jgi:hypothetical protein